MNSDSNDHLMNSAMSAVRSTVWKQLTLPHPDHEKTGREELPSTGPAQEMLDISHSGHHAANSAASRPWRTGSNDENGLHTRSGSYACLTSVLLVGLEP